MDILLAHAQRHVEEYFGSFEHGGLKSRVSHIVATHIRASAKQTLGRIEFLLKIEAEPFTRNRHYFLDYRAKFLEHFTNLRKKGPTARFVAIVEACPSEAKSLRHSPDVISRALTPEACHLTRPASSKVLIPQEEDHPAGYLLNTRARPSTRSETVNALDPMAPALGIMADARAYFQVAYKRFVDNVPMTLDQSLVLGILDGLDGVIFRGLGVNGEDAYENCRRLLAEPEERRAVRGRLERRKERLLGAQRELEEVFVQ